MRKWLLLMVAMALVSLLMVMVQDDPKINVYPWFPLVFRLP